MNNKSTQFSDNILFRKRKEMIFRSLCSIVTWSSIVILLVLIYSVAKSGLNHLSFDFLNNFPSRFPHKAGIKSALYGSVWLLITVSIISIPVGVGAAIFLEEYSKIHSSIKDKTHIKSWFRDQVLHPHETLHTVKEMIPLLDAEGLKITHTSVNKFAPINFNKGNYDEVQLKNIFELEKEMENDSIKALEDRRYYPGFFTFLAK